MAEAAAIAARGEAEAEAMRKRAEAYKHYGQAAVVDILAGTLPKVVAEAASPMSRIDKMTVISTDGAGQAVRNVASTAAQANEMLKALFGIDLTQLVAGLTGAAGNGDGGAPPAVEAGATDGGSPA